jgi:hypothetical protein
MNMREFLEEQKGKRLVLAGPHSNRKKEWRTDVPNTPSYAIDLVYFTLETKQISARKNILSY